MYVNVDAIILRSERVGEKDKRLVLFTREEGRLSALAMGARQPRARLACATEPGVQSRFRLWMAKDKGMARVTGGSLVSSFPAARSHWHLMNSATFFCEWATRLTTWYDPNERKFDLLVRSLSALGQQDEATVRLAFMMQFLEQAGYGMNRRELHLPETVEWASLMRYLSNYDFQTPMVTDIPEKIMKLLEERLIQFAGSLSPHPFQSQTQRQSMRDYMDNAPDFVSRPLPVGPSQ